jgi:HlyD family secretion protein
MQWKKRHMTYSAVAIAIVLILAFALRPEAVRVETATVEKGPMSVTIDSRGETRVVDRFVIAAPISGRIERIDLREGTAIEPGQVVARIAAIPVDPRQREEAEARIAAAEATRREAAATVASTEAAWELARRERERAEQLEREGVATRQMLDQTRTAEERARRDLDAARQRRQAATSNLAGARAALQLPDRSGEASVLEVRSPVAGTVFRVPERSERIVTAGQPILELGDAAQLELVIDVLSEDAVKIRPGNRVIVDQWGGDRPLEGSVRLIEPSAFTKISALGIEEQRVNIVADLENAPPELGDGYRIEGRIVIWESPDVLRVPVSALARHEGGWSVFVVEDGLARRRPIEAGRRNPLEAELLSGLEPGEVVIVHPGFDVRDGVRVRASS